MVGGFGQGSPLWFLPSFPSFLLSSFLFSSLSSFKISITFYFFCLFAGKDSLPTHGQTALLHGVKWKYDMEIENRHTHPPPHTHNQKSGYCVTIVMLYSSWNYLYILCIYPASVSHKDWVDRKKGGREKERWRQYPIFFQHGTSSLLRCVRSFLYYPIINYKLFSKEKLDFKRIKLENCVSYGKRWLAATGLKQER